MTDVLTLDPHSHVRSSVRRTAPSLPALTALEIRKSLSTRSGKALAVAAALVGPAAMALMGIAAGEEFPFVDGPLGAVGVMTGMLLLALGVLSTAGEWTHRTAETTFLLVPHRGRVLAAKTGALALLGVVLAAVGAALSVLVLLGIVPETASWDGAGRAVLAVIGAGAVFAVTGAGLGAAVGNSAAALTGVYLLVLGALPIVRLWSADVAEWLDPTSATMSLATGSPEVRPVLVLVGWVVVTSVVGHLLTRRRPVG
ncbi:MULTISPECIES: hypothetical protein [unclassified Blastococcus]